MKAMNPVYRKRLLRHKIGIALSVLAMAVGLFFLFWILATLLIKGFGAVSLAMFAESTPPVGQKRNSPSGPASAHRTDQRKPGPTADSKAWIWPRCAVDSRVWPVPCAFRTPSRCCSL